MNVAFLNSGLHEWRLVFVSSFSGPMVLRFGREIVLRFVQNVRLNKEHKSGHRKILHGQKLFMVTNLYKHFGTRMQ